MRAGGEVRWHTILETAGKNYPDMPGTTATPVPKPTQSVGKNQTPGDFMT